MIRMIRAAIQTYSIVWWSSSPGLDATLQRDPLQVVEQCNGREMDLAKMPAAGKLETFGLG